ncbi:MAG: mechanosensitive ion channel family protein [Crocinitomicaceae bacterium]
MTKMVEAITGKVLRWLEQIIDMLPNLALSIIVLIAFVFIARFSKKGMVRVLDKTYKNTELSRVLGQLTHVALIITGLMISLSIMGLDKTVTSVLAGAGIIGLALSFAFQDLAANLISGFYMASKNPFEIGDVIKVNDHMGTVKDIQLRSTLMETLDGNEVRIPNRILFENPLMNFYETKTRRIELKVGVSYGEDIERVEKITVEAIRKLPIIIEGTEVEFIYTGFGESSIDFQVMYWVPYDDYMQYLRGVSAGIKEVKKAFDENDIVIPFPIRTLDFGIKGGQKLEESLKNQNNQSIE